jgi:hypothetical protein
MYVRDETKFQLKKKLGPRLGLAILLLMAGIFYKTTHHERFLDPYHILHQKYHFQLKVRAKEKKKNK